MESFTTFFESPTTKLISLFILFSITIYFAYVSAHGSRKSFFRSQGIEKTKHVANKENKFLVLNSQINLLNNVRTCGKYFYRTQLYASYLQECREYGMIPQHNVGTMWFYWTLNI